MQGSRGSFGGQRGPGMDRGSRGASMGVPGRFSRGPGRPLGKVISLWGVNLSIV